VSRVATLVLPGTLRAALSTWLGLGSAGGLVLATNAVEIF
jgi:hypothetical protein